MANTHAQLTAPEISQLWSDCLSDTLILCQLRYFEQHVEDQEIAQIIQTRIEKTREHYGFIVDLFNAIGYPIPVGFNENEDVDINSDRLFTDHYMLEFLRQLSQISMNAYGTAAAFSTRPDIRQFYADRLQDSQQLNEEATSLGIDKGYVIIAPSLPIPSKPDFVKKKSFLTGWFGERRPVTGSEITFLFANIQRNAIGAATMMGFAQTTASKTLQRYFQRGKDIANKHIEIFSSILRENDVPVPMTWDTEVTDQTSFVFSDKLMLYQTLALNSLGLGFYGLSMSNSPRHDLGVHYTRLMAEIAQFTEDGTELMIDHGWLEQPPQAANRRQLMNE
ncbi:DUF3231 family protein [Alkalibacillus salilacus]|uniref:DUF3231 family protein n=1 Tax=Alkalibacillus salilacus TaxID=284582 RepID=A0ABT9VG98_9BACI|nr:DUF3231 family protein [Alkalibacillus salilacus]MDQ0159875.1 hypothetical protein [Alkalibacillus salilacus]